MTAASSEGRERHLLRCRRTALSTSQSSETESQVALMLLIVASEGEQACKETVEAILRSSKGIPGRPSSKGEKAARCAHRLRF